MGKRYQNEPSYPYRIYGMYNWNGNKWVINKDFCLKNNIDISKIQN